MRLDANWMTRADGRILELLEEEGPSTPSEIASDNRIRFSRQHVGNRCREFLEPYGLVNNDEGEYSITPKGREYLRGELDAESLTPAHL